MFDGYGIDGGQPITSLELVNHTLSSYYDMFLVCSLLANLSAAAAAAAATSSMMTTGRPAAPISPSLPLFEGSPDDDDDDDDDLTLQPCTDISAFWRCLYEYRPMSNRRNQPTLTTESSATTIDHTTDGDVTTETPLEFVEHLLEQNIGVFSDVVDDALLGVLVVGVLGNIIAAATVVNDNQTPSSWRWLYCSCIGLDQLLLIVNIAMLSLNAMRPTATGTDSVIALSSMPTWWLERLVAMNVLSSLLGAIQLIQPWLLHLLCGHVRQCLITERESHRRHGRRQAPEDVVDKRPLPTLPSFPVCQCLVIIALGVVFFVASLPPVRVQLFFNVPHHTTLCNVPLVDHWNLIVDGSAGKDPFYLTVYCLSYVVVVHLAPVLPLLHRIKKVIDELSKRPDDISTDTGLATLCRWSTVLSATSCLHVVGTSCKSVLVAMRLVDCACALPFGVTTTVTMVRGDVAFRYLNGFANFGQLVVRPCCHLPVRLANDWRLRTDLYRFIFGLRRIVVGKLTKGRQWLTFLPGFKLRRGQSAENNGVIAGSIEIVTSEKSCDHLPSAV